MQVIENQLPGFYINGTFVENGLNNLYSDLQILFYFRCSLIDAKSVRKLISRSVTGGELVTLKEDNMLLYLGYPR